MPITLTTDFGYKDAFVGIMKGVMLGINPNAQLIDLTHGIPAQDVMAAALVLRHAVGNFPPGSIHVAVVDPGVGSRREPLLLECENQFFIGPDNGIFSLALQDAEPKSIICLSNRKYHRQPTSATFHGRDVFAPAAAHLSLGIPPRDLGERRDSYVKLTLPKIAVGRCAIAAEVIYIDAYGNLFTNIEERDLKGLPEDGLTITLGETRIHGLSRNYAAAAEGQFVALINSWGLLEIAVNRGNAQRSAGVGIGDGVRVLWETDAAGEIL